MSGWLRCRFNANEEDYRPVTWPPPGPYWCSGYGDGYSIVVAYVREWEQVEEFWPEAENIDATEESELTFSGRFPEPEWWAEVQESEALLGTSLGTSTNSENGEPSQDRMNAKADDRT